MREVPLHKHDWCEECVFLGPYRVKDLDGDLYIHEHGEGDDQWLEVLFRFGEDGDYYCATFDDVDDALGDVTLGFAYCEAALRWTHYQSNLSEPKVCACPWWHWCYCCHICGKSGGH